MNKHAWFLKDLDNIKKNNIKVMSTFACGGGSSMGYKLAGCEVVAANDIDPVMAMHYKKNIRPLHYFLCPIRDLLTTNLPPELFNLDILDGSPPCSTFSMSGNREKDWGKDKHFREGQAKQVLSDLFFDFLDLVGHLKPRVVVAENVKGMITGNAKGYTKMIMERFRELGYLPQLFLLNAADCGVPQKRQRIFFCAVRKDLNAPPLVLAPSHKWITCGEATNDIQDLTDEERQYTSAIPTDEKYYKDTLPGQSYSKVFLKRHGRSSFFNHQRLHKNRPSITLMAGMDKISHWSEMRKITHREAKRLHSFPDDYYAKNDRIGNYMIGMSVPPRMTETIARAVCAQWLGVTP